MLANRVRMAQTRRKGDKYSAYFNGTNAYLSIANTNNRLQPQDQFTWECLFKLESYTQYNTLMGFKTNDWDFARMDSVNQFQCHTYSTSNVTTQNFITPSGFPNINDGEWHHMAISRNLQGESWAFIDGIQRYYDNANQQLRSRTVRTIPDFHIGAILGVGIQRHIKGWIKEVRIWDIPKTQIEIANNMHESLTGNEHGLKILVAFDEDYTAQTTIKDKASNYDININNVTFVK